MSVDWAKWQGHEQPPALSQVTLLSSTWTDLPEDVQKDIEKLWEENEYGNDNYYFKYDEDLGYECDWENNYPALWKYLNDHEVKKCLIHWWW